jgi:hypothetical protein
MKKSFFTKLRERQEARKFARELAAARAEGEEAGRRHRDIVARAEWAAAALATALRCNESVEVVEKLTVQAETTAAELREENRRSIADLERGLALVNAGRTE